MRASSRRLRSSSTTRILACIITSSGSLFLAPFLFDFDVDLFGFLQGFDELVVRLQHADPRFRLIDPGALRVFADHAVKVAGGEAVVALRIGDRRRDDAEIEDRLVCRRSVIRKRDHPLIFPDRGLEVLLAEKTLGARERLPGGIGVLARLEPAEPAAAPERQQQDYLGNAK